MKTKSEAQNTPTAGRKARQSNTLGKASREQIIATAEILLSSHGYHGLSTRKVAEACGISVGNLTYHFPNKIQLVQALVASVCSRYESQRPSIHPKADQPARQYLQRLIGWMIDDAAADHTRSLFLELWILAKHHDFGAAALEQLYATVTQWITDSLAMYFPRASRLRCQQAAYFILTISEGSVVTFPPSKSSKSSKSSAVTSNQLVEFAVAGVLAVLDEA